ncbi:hypothetical protein GGF42_002459 [Coemansia sp. RSA 2424]|nr:hypothetical protein GGF42_002459 [Coemansia sp. RSA 2424]
MTEHYYSPTPSNSTQLKRKASHDGSVLETEQQGWVHGATATSPRLQPLQAEATQPPRKRRHATTEAMSTAGHDRLCSRDLLYGRKPLSGKVSSPTREANSLFPLNSRKRKDDELVSNLEKPSSSLLVPSERDLGAQTTKRARIDQAEEEGALPVDHVDAAAIHYSDGEQEDEQPFPKYTIIPLPLSLRTQAYFQCQPQRQSEASKAPVHRQSALASSGGGRSSNALILYNPDINKQAEAADEGQAAAGSDQSSASTMDID